MISVIQRCSKAKVDIKNKTVGEIGHGMVVLLGIQKDDSKEDADYLVKKLSTLRMFNDSDNKMNLSIKDVKGNENIESVEIKNITEDYGAVSYTHLTLTTNREV